MWFNNALAYRFELPQPTDIAASLLNEHLKPCPPHARFIYGWTPVFSNSMAHDVSGCTLIQMGKEERLLPRGVIQRFLSERIQNLETQRGYAVKRAEKAQLTEEIEFDLLPKAFCLQKNLPAILDFTNQRLIINTASSSQASQLIVLLRKSLPSIHIEPLQNNDNLTSNFAQWLTNPTTLPANLELANDCILYAKADDKKRLHFKGCELPSDDINNFIAQGFIVAELSLSWNERIQFTLTQDGIIKRLKCLDYLTQEFNETRQLDDEYQQQDASLILLSNELRGLFHELGMG